MPGTSMSRISRRFGWALLGLALSMGVSLRWRVLDAPLQRDEGEYAYAGQLLLNGIPPYEQVYNLKFPGIYAAYAGVMAIFGETVRGIHSGLSWINAATILAVFFLARRSLGDLAAGVSAIVFATLSLGPALQGAYANAEHFVLLPAVTGLVVLMRALEGWRIAAFPIAGVLLGTGVTMKQQGAAFVLLALVLVALDARARQMSLVTWGRGTGALLLGVSTPLLLAAGILAAAGVLPSFWYWAVSYAWTYTGHMSLEGSWMLLKIFGGAVAAGSPWLWVLAGAGCSALIWDERVRGQTRFLLPTLLFSLLAVAPGLNFRPHYFVLALPAFSLLAGAFCLAVERWMGKNAGTLAGALTAVLIALACVGGTLASQRQAMFELTPVDLTRVSYGPRNPFAESLRIASFIGSLADPGDSIAVFGSEPQICFYSELRCATGHIYMYPLMENHDAAIEMQREMIRELEERDPAWFVYVSPVESWLDSSSLKNIRMHDSDVLAWLELRKAGLDRVFVVELSPEGARFHAGPALVARRRFGGPIVEVYRRREAPTRVE
ncbi:glycosyltransferase family 39 protein [Myxococcota bacterium]|nr:glycosyltransferase family 39 protein [Myxococcota bacterium]